MNKLSDECEMLLREADYSSSVLLFALFCFKSIANNISAAWQFFAPSLGWLSDPFKWLSDLQLGDEKVTLNHLMFIFFWLLWLSWCQKTVFSNCSPGFSPVAHRTGNKYCWWKKSCTNGMFTIWTGDFTGCLPPSLNSLEKNADVCCCLLLARKFGVCEFSEAVKTPCGKLAEAIYSIHCWISKRHSAAVEGLYDFGNRMIYVPDVEEQISRAVTAGVKFGIKSLDFRMNYTSSPWILKFQICRS